MNFENIIDLSTDKTPKEKIETLYEIEGGCASEHEDDNEEYEDVGDLCLEDVEVDLNEPTLTLYEWFFNKYIERLRTVQKPVFFKEPSQEHILGSEYVTWATFEKVEKSSFVTIGNVVHQRKAESKPVKKSFAFKGVKKQKPAPQKPKSNKLCSSIVNYNSCNRAGCVYVHNYNDINKCTQGDKCKSVIALSSTLFVLAEGGKCHKRHGSESVESFLLREKIVLNNCKDFVVNVNKNLSTFSVDLFKTFLTNAKEYGIGNIIIKPE